MGKTTSVTKSKKTQSSANAKKDIFAVVQARRDKYAMVLPDSGQADRFVSACLIAISMDVKLQQANRDSLLKAIMESARYGLEPNSPLGEAALVCYGSKVEFLIEYRGMLKLAWQSGLVEMIDYDIIKENDQFEFQKGFNAKFEHSPLLTGARGKPIAYYAYAEIKGGGKVLTLMSKDEIVEHGKQYSKSFGVKSSPWQTNFDAMAIKTVLRQLVDKKLPKSTTVEGRTLARAGHIEDIPEERIQEYDATADVIIDNAPGEIPFE